MYAGGVQYKRIFVCVCVVAGAVWQLRTGFRTAKGWPKDTSIERVGRRGPTKRTLTAIHVVQRGLRESEGAALAPSDWTERSEGQCGFGCYNNGSDPGGSR